ncbi:MAG: nodulation protein NodZ [Pseudomonadota bacterium]
MTEGPGKALIIKAKGGLGNRMLSAITGIVLARLNKRAPYIDWRDGMYVEAGENLYPLLFDASEMGDLSVFDDAIDVAPALWSGRMTEQPVDVIRREFPNQHQDPLLYRKLSIDLTGEDPDERVGVFWSYLPKLERLKRRMKSLPQFAGKSLSEVTSELLAQHFRPVAKVNEQVDAIFADQSAPVIGVHIRFTDRKVPLAKIISALEQLAQREAEARIFLATDSAEAQSAILERFPHVMTIEKSLAHDSTALHFSSEGFSDPVVEAHNALIDMVALSRCDWLLHSRHSTFSVTAALMGRIPQKRQVDIDRYNLKVVAKQFVQARL